MQDAGVPPSVVRRILSGTRAKTKVLAHQNDTGRLCQPYVRGGRDGLLGAIDPFEYYSVCKHPADSVAPCDKPSHADDPGDKSHTVWKPSSHLIPEKCANNGHDQISHWRWPILDFCVAASANRCSMGNVPTAVWADKVAHDFLK